MFINRSHLLLGIPQNHSKLKQLLPCTPSINAQNCRKIWKLSKTAIPNLAAKLRKYEFRKTSVQLIGAPLVYGQPLHGSDAAPVLLRESFLPGRMKAKGVKLRDDGDLRFKLIANDNENVTGCKFAKTVGDSNREIALKVESSLKASHQALLLGGDHSVSLGSVYGHAKVYPNMAVLWVDAHPDINTPLTSISGNIHGMVMAFLMEELDNPTVPGLEWLKPCISSNQVGYIGLRSIDPSEKIFLEKLNICVHTSEDVKNLGVDEVMRKTLDRIDPQNNKSIHFSLDVDSLDPTVMPATGTPVPNGLTLRQGLRIAKIVHSTGRMRVMDVVELNPLLTSRGVAHWCADVTVEIIMRAFCSKNRTLPWDKPFHRGSRTFRFKDFNK